MIMNKVFKSLRNINWRLFAALLVLGLCPAVYSTVRTFFLGQLPGEWSYSIAGQLSWVNLIYEIVNEAIILPLFFFIGKVISDKKEFTNRVKTGLLISLGVYAILSAVILIFAEPLLSAMAASPDIIKESATYIRIEGIANIFGILFSFVSVALISLGKDRFVYILTGIKLVLCIISDTFLAAAVDAFGRPVRRTVEVLLVLHDPCDGILAVAVQIQLENLPDDGCGLRVDDPAFLVLRVFHIAVRGLGERFACSPSGIVRRPHLAADILGVQLVHDILDGDKIVHVRCPVNAVHIIVDGDKADIVVGKIVFGVISHLQVFTPETGHILNDDRADISHFNIIEQLLKARPIEC